MSKPMLLQRAASRAVVMYVRHSPIERGKWRLLQFALRFLVAEVADGVYVRVCDPSDTVGLRMIRSGDREPETMQLFRELLSPGMTVVDAGANIGEYALVAAHDMGPNGSVHAFEPTPAIIDRLRENIALNGFRNIRVNANALSSQAGAVSLRVDRDEPDTNYIATGAPSDGSVVIDALTLDDYVQQAGLPRVDLIKMDIEGAEVMALTGARRVLSGTDAPVLIVEANQECLARAGSSIHELLALLLGCGYSCYVIDSYGTGAYSNVLAAKAYHFERYAALDKFRTMRPLDVIDAEPMHRPA